MHTTRGIAGVLVKQLIAEGLIYEGATGDISRGRKPVTLHVRTRDRLVVAVDVRVSRIHLMLCDFGGRQVAFKALDPILSPAEFVRQLIQEVRGILAAHNARSQCEGIGVVIPVMVDRDTGLVLNAPLLGWRDVEIQEPIALGTGLPDTRTATPVTRTAKTATAAFRETVTPREVCRRDPMEGT
jgi:hypothetical protein